MIHGIEIRNFRCFEETKISGFKRLNLIGGLNHSGKTALLEALFLGNCPSAQGIRTIRQIRKESLPFLKTAPDRAWDSFFLDTEKEIQIVSKINGSSNSFRAYLSSSLSEETDPESSGPSRLFMEWEISGENPGSITFRMDADSKGIRIRNISRKGKKQAFMQADFILSSDPVSELAVKYDQAELAGKGDYILHAVRLTEPLMEQIRTFSIGEPLLYLKRKGDKFLPVSLYGEAIAKIMDYTVRIVSRPGRILFIDEIENGIHYTNHRKLWEMLFRLAPEFDIQIFAATHSLEMIQAFAETGLQQKDRDCAAYTELIRNVRTGRIAGICRDVKELDYTLKRGVEVRGER